MAGADVSSRLVCTRNSVRGISWRTCRAPGEISHPFRLLPMLPNLERLCIRSNLFIETCSECGVDLSRAIPKLTGLYLCFKLGGQSNTFEGSFWRTITHLNLCTFPIHYPNSPFINTKIFRSMTSLTHLAITEGWYSGAYDNLRVASDRLIAALPPSLKLCLWEPMTRRLSPHSDDLIRFLAVGILDPRIVLWNACPSFKLYGTLRILSEAVEIFDWFCGVPDGWKTFWELAEAIQEEKIGRPAPNEVIYWNMLSFSTSK
ncbi:hypothetical protein DL96DRAFT_783080 [Flagelloscypha sp. PMI_526]|nr:hypothetical protein DL96DRAFT_783080 [Flagelloscypha sp. PMI_526]